MKLHTQYLDFYQFLLDNVRKDCLPVDDNQFAAWMGDIDENGHIEIRGQFSVTGNPITGSLPDLAL